MEVYSIFRSFRKITKKSMNFVEFIEISGNFLNFRIMEFRNIILNYKEFWKFRIISRTLTYIRLFWILLRWCINKSVQNLAFSSPPWMSLWYINDPIVFLILYRLYDNVTTHIRQDFIFCCVILYTTNLSINILFSQNWYLCLCKSY